MAAANTTRTPAKNRSLKRLVYISPENRAHLLARAPKLGNNGGGAPSVDFALNGALARYFGLMEGALREVWAALPDECDREFVRRVLAGFVVAGDDVTPAQMPLSILSEIAEAAAENPDACTPALPRVLQRLGPLHGAALWDWSLIRE